MILLTAAPGPYLQAHVPHQFVPFAHMGDASSHLRTWVTRSDKGAAEGSLAKGTLLRAQHHRST